MKDFERIVKLRQIIEEHRIRYHVHDRPSISDEEYDSLIRELIELEKKYPELDDDLSPSKRIGESVLEKFAKIKHIYKQWSFDNVFNFEELDEWNNRNAKIIEKQGE